MERPIIIVEPGRLPWLVDAAERAIISNYRKWGLYQRGDLLVQATTLTEDTEKPVRRRAGAPILRVPPAVAVQDVFGRAIDWRVRDKDDKSRPIDCPMKIANTYTARASWNLPHLVGIVEAPIMRPDGSILFEPGYDERTGLLLHSTTRWSQPPSLSREAVSAAVRTLRKPFQEFPMSDAHRSVIVSGILTGLQRRLLFSAPAHAFDKPTQGSGGSLLADCISIIVTGRPVASTSANGDEEELRKKLAAILVAGDAVVSFDNITKPLHSDALASILTLPEWQDRILGATQRVHLITNSLFLLTGNNLTFTRDMPSRVIVARIEPDCERPEERAFDISDLRAHVLEYRVDLVQAALTILQAYFIAGRPEQGVKPYGRFEQWSREIREAIIWAGEPDPCATREAIIAADPERDATLALLENWHSSFVESEITLRRLVEEAERKDADGTLLAGDLRAALLEVAADIDNPREVSSYRLGAWCRNRVGRVVAGYKLIRGGTRGAGFAAWRVVRLSEANSQIGKAEEVTKEL